MNDKSRKNTRVNDSGIIKKESVNIKKIDTANLMSRYLPWTVAFIYTVYIAILIFSFHRTGWFGVETDFYAELVVQAKKLLSGNFSPLNYGPKGPAYSVILAGFYLIIRDYFLAGIIINLIAAFVLVLSAYFLIEKVFNRLTAAISIIALVLNYSFQNYTFQIGSDMPFMAFCALSMFFLYDNRGNKNIILSAVFGLLAFLTRYNGAFLIAGTILYFAVVENPLKTRIKNSALWLGVFAVVGLPWFIPNWIVSGSPFHNDNYYNVVMEFYGISKGGFSYESWMENLPAQFKSISDIIFYDPIYFFRHLALNVVRHFTADMMMLIKIPVSIFTVIGILMTLFSKPGIKKLIYAASGVIYFMILTLVFYNERFVLFLLVFYLPFTVWPWTDTWIALKFIKLKKVILSLIILSIVFMGTYTVPKIVYEISHPQPIVEGLKDLGLALGKVERDKTQKIIARVPHVAHYSGLIPVMFPENINNVDDLVSFCKRENIHYIAYSGAELKARPALNILFDPNFSNPDLEIAVSNSMGVVYRVVNY